MAIYLSRGDGTESGLWHEMARDDLKIPLKLKIDGCVWLWFGLVWGFYFIFKNMLHKEHQDKNSGYFLYLPHLAMKAFSRQKDCGNQWTQKTMCSSKSEKLEAVMLKGNGILPSPHQSLVGLHLLLLLPIPRLVFIQLF